MKETLYKVVYDSVPAYKDLKSSWRDNWQDKGSIKGQPQQNKAGSANES